MARRSREDMMADYPVGTIIGEKEIVSYINTPEALYVNLRCIVEGCNKIRTVSYANFIKSMDTIIRHGKYCAGKRSTEELKSIYYIGRIIGDKMITGYVEENSKFFVSLTCTICNITKNVSVSNLESLFDTITKHGKSCNMKPPTISSSLIHNPIFDERINKKIYNTFLQMHRRCEYTESPDYVNYGGRGICVSDLFAHDDQGYANFQTLMAPLLIETVSQRINDGQYTSLEEALFSTTAVSLDRIDVNGNYEPGNIRWADRALQVLNSRKMIGKEFFAYSPNGEVYFTNNMTRFCNNHGLNIGHVHECLIGKRPSHHKWTFQYYTRGQLFVYDMNNPNVASNIIKEIY